MHGFKRIFVFCLVTTLLPALLIILPLWLRHSKYADVHYKVAESDILEIRHGISSIFCERHSLRMNTTFNAFQLNRKPRVSEIRKHIRLRKSMILPDDTLEYWGFYLLKGATVSLKVCSRYDGSRILVVKGDKDLKTCGLLEHNKNKYGTNSELGNVIVTFETNAEVIVNDTVANATDRTPVFEDEDDLGEHFDVPKITKYSGDDEDEDENTAAERDEIAFTPLRQTTSTTTTTTTRRPRPSRRQKPNKSKSKEVVEEEKVASSEGHKKKKHSSATTTKARSQEAIRNSAEEATQRRDPLISQTTASNRPIEGADNDSDTREEEEKDKTVDPLSLEAWEQLGKSQSLREQPVVNGETTTEHGQINLRDLDDTDLTSEERRILEKYLDRVEQKKLRKQRPKRDVLLERRVNHGGTALNFTEGANSNSVSSFENNLLTCYDGQILLAQSFPPSTLCRNVKYLEQGSHMVTTHEITSDGYYYYIFYSDNDNVKNDINALFDIHKPTFLYANISDTSKCYNATNCSFPIDFLTDEVVIVEVPTRDGIEHEGDDFTELVSTCHPRMGVYVIFPVAVLFLILTCAFL